MVPKYPAARARINRNGSDSSGSEISCDTGITEHSASRLSFGFPASDEQVPERHYGRKIETFNTVRCTQYRGRSLLRSC